MKVIFTKGLQGSGKSTAMKRFVKDNQDYKRVCRDDIRHMLSNYTYDDKNEKLVTVIERRIINDLINSGYNLVIDKMNLNEKYFKDDLNFIKECYFYVCKKVDEKPDFDYEIKEFPITLYEAIERDKKRDFQIGESVIKKTWKTYEVELKQMLERAKPKYEENKSLPHCVIIDIDGTLALSPHRKIFDSSYDDIMKDKVVEQVKELNNLYLFVNASVLLEDEDRKHIFILSGRSENDRKVTEEWLAQNGIIYDKLIMRKLLDNRDDAIVKSELFEEYVRGKFYCDYVVDDRIKVLDMWIKKGLFTFNVNQDPYATNQF